MATSSFHNFSLLISSHRHKSSKAPRLCDNPLHVHNPLFTHSNLKHLSLKPLCTTSNHSQISIPLKPTSNPPTLKKISSFFTEKIVFFLIGSFIFMGCLCNKPVLAVGIQKSEKMEEKRDTQEEENENKDEVMYEKLLEQNPRDVEALKAVFHKKMGKGKTKEAVVYAERLIEVQPGEVEWRLLQALCYEMMGQFSKSKRLFKDILAKKPLLLRALHGLAMVMHKNREGPAVFEMLNTAQELARRDKRVTEERNIRILIAQMHVVKGDLEEGLKHFQALVDENPRDFRPYLCQGIIYSLLDKKNEAEEQFGIYRSLVPDEFPQRGFLDDVVLAAKTSSHEQLEKEFQDEYSYKSS